jgi:hypothetical protein
VNALVIAVNTTDVVGLCVLAVAGAAFTVLIEQVKKGGRVPTWRKPKDKDKK